MRSIPLLLIMLASLPVTAAAQALGPQLAGQPAPPQVARDLGQRPAAWQPITEAGPAAPSPEPAAPAARAAAPVAGRSRSVASVVTLRGQPLHGAVRIAHNRVYDPHSGVYYWTSGAGPGEVALP